MSRYSALACAVLVLAIAVLLTGAALVDHKHPAGPTTPTGTTTREAPAAGPAAAAAATGPVPRAPQP